MNQKLSLALQLAQYDSINNTPPYIKGEYYKDLLLIADIYNRKASYPEEEKYLKMVLCIMFKDSTLYRNNDYFREKESVLIRLFNNSLNQKKYSDALIYDETIAQQNLLLHGFDENSYFDYRDKFDRCIKNEFGDDLLGSMGLYNVVYYGWSDEIYGLMEHLIRKASVLYGMQKADDAIALCLLSDSIKSSCNQFSPYLMSKMSRDFYPKCLLSKCFLKLGKNEMAIRPLYEAFMLSRRYYWDFSVLQQQEESKFKFGKTIFSESDRRYVLNSFENLRDLIYSSTYKINSQSINTLCYNQCLFEKQILLETTKLINRIAISTNNPHYNNVIQLRHKLDSASNIFSIDSIEQIIAEEERLLINEISFHIGQTEKSSLMCSEEDIKTMLFSDVAIEYFTAPLNEDSTMYCALLLRSNSEYPEMIPLFEEKEVSVLLNTSSENQTSFTYSYGGNGKQLSNLIWSKILPHIKSGETVYFAPSGILHQLAVEALPYDSTRTMTDVYNLVRLSSTRELVLNKSHDTRTTAALYGGIQYDMSGDEILAESEQYSSTTLLASRGIENDTLDRRNVKYLPGTKKEVESINRMLTDNNLSVQLFTTTNANEESFKALSGKHQNILHIATHGFYWSDSTAQTKDYFSQRLLLMDDKMPSPPTIDPLNRCGLLFAGANTALSGHSADLPEGVQDGILTAKEISLLDLRDANLVVLSACETGNGEITGEGVFGLQRAFKQAGAQTIIMSLWPVNDAATQLLMTEFYRNWITNRQTKRTAFRNAQNTVRSKYEEPVYWAGFIMLD